MAYRFTIPAASRFVSKMTQPMTTSTIVPWTTTAATATTTRSLSSAGASAVERFREAMENYRCQHYRQETHDRFRKDIVKATFSLGSYGIMAEAMERLVKNVEVSDRISRQDIDVIVRELGDDGSLSVDGMMTLLP